MSKVHDGCVGCKYQDRTCDQEPCCKCVKMYTDMYKPETNADRIRQMSDGELAGYMSDNTGMSKKWWLNKLQSEVEKSGGLE